MATLTANQIHKTYVSQSGTPFNIWIKAEKDRYMQKKGLTEEDCKNNPGAFTRYLNSRYRVGGENLWTNYVQKNVMNQNDADINEATKKAVFNESAEGDKKVQDEVNATKDKPEVSEADAKTIPFMKRRYYNMPAPVAVGLGLIFGTAVIYATVATIKHFKKK